MLARLTTIAGVAVVAMALQFSCTRSGGTEDGAALFASSCARCHGNDRRGRSRGVDRGRPAAQLQALVTHVRSFDSK